MSLTQRTSSYGVGRAWRALAVALARDTLRDRQSMVLLLLTFVALLGVFGGVDLLLDASGAIVEAPSLLQSSLALVSLTGFLGIACMMTMVPLARHRGEGLLRVLNTAPVGLGTYILAHVLVRAGLILVESVIIVGVFVLGGHSFVFVAQFAVTLLLGAGMLLALGYLLGARLTNPDTARQLAYLLPVAVLATSGALVPLTALPGGMQTALRIFPTTWFVDAINAQLAGQDPAIPLGITWLLMALTAVLMGYVAARLFCWSRVS